MDKSLLLPLGYKIDINYYKASKYSKSFPVKECCARLRNKRANFNRY